MKSLIDLKSEIQDGKLNNLYIFTGEEYKIRQVYYNKIAELHANLKIVDSVDSIFKELQQKALFAVNTTLFCYNDVEFLKQKESTYNKLLSLLDVNYIVVLVFENIPEKSTFMKVFEDYVTNFGNVTTEIANRYVLKESDNLITEEYAQQLAYNCFNNYGHIIEETNKIKHLSKSGKIHEFQSTSVMKSLFTNRFEIPTSRQVADALIKRSIYEFNNIIDLVKRENILGYIPEIISTINISLYFKVYNKYEGSTKAYESGEYWGRVKELRDYYIPYNKNDLLDIRYMLYNLDLDVRSGRMKQEHAWDYLIGVIL